jgi:hypothetical protein
MSTVDERATDILAWAIQNQHRRGVRRHVMLAELGFNNGTKTQAAIKRAWQMAAAIGMHMPAPYHGNAYEIHITGNPREAAGSVDHLLKIIRGLVTRTADGVAFMEAHAAELDGDVAAEVAVLVANFADVDAATDAMKDASTNLRAMLNGRAA